MTPARAQGAENKTGLVTESATRFMLFWLTSTTQGQKPDTCLQGDGFTGLTVTITVYSNNTDIIENATR